MKTLFLLVVYLLANTWNGFCQNTKIDSLIAEVSKNTADTNQVNNLYSISKYLIYRDPDKAIEYNNKAITMADKLSFQKGKANALDISGIYYQNKGDYEKTEEFYTQSLNIRLKLKSLRLIAISYNNFGVLNRRQGNFDKSKEFFLKSLSVSLELKDTLALSRVYNNLGLVTENQGKYEESISYHLKSLEIREKIGNKEDIASSLNNIGILFMAIEKYKEALNYLTKSLEIKIRLSNKGSLASTYTNIGSVYFYLNDFGKALDYQTKSKDIYEAIGDKKSLGTTLSNLAYMAKRKGDLQLARKYSLQSIKIIEEIGSLSQLCDSYNGASLTFFELKDYTSAKNYAFKAYDIATKNNYRPELKASLNSLYLIYTSLNDYKLANKYLSQFVAVKDSLFNEANNKQILELQTKYETVKKEKEIVLLSEKTIQQELSIEKRKKTVTSLVSIFLLISISTALIIRQNRIKQKQKALTLEHQLLRSQLNPHFIFNALGAIQNQVLQKPAIEAAIYISSFAKLMRNTLNSSRDELIPLDSDIETLKEYLSLQKLRLKDKLQYQFTTDLPYETSEIAIPPMLLQPFIENAVEHGIAKKDIVEGNIWISFKASNERIIITVDDDGVGLNNYMVSNTNKHESLATKITQERMLALTKSYKKEFRQSISNRINSEGKIVGAKVILDIPLLFLD